MMTTRARSGSAAWGPSGIAPSPLAARRPGARRSAGPGGRPPETPRCPALWLTSVLPLDVIEEPGKLTAGEPLCGALVTLHRPGPEVEVERARRPLDRSPQRPAVLAHQAEEPGPGDLVPQHGPVVG